MYACAPGTIVLVGVVSDHDGRLLLDYCSRLAFTGQEQVTLDVDGVVEFDRGGLLALIELRSGKVGLEATVHGARWDQFAGPLGRTGTDPVGSLADHVHALVAARAVTHGPIRGTHITPLPSE